MIRKILFLFLFLTISILSFANSKGFEGYWIMPDGKFIIKIDKETTGEYVGHVAWLKNKVYPKGDKEAGIEQHDRKNDNPKLRDRKVLGLKVVGNLYEKNGKLQNGYVYDSWNGNMYYGSAKLDGDDTLLLKGSLDRFGIFGLTQKAKRVTNLSTYGL